MFLGTAGDPIAVSKQLRRSNGILLKFDDVVFFLDPGPGSMANAVSHGLNLRELSALVLSHGHLNHSGDANAVISAMTLGGLDKRGVLIAPKAVVFGDEKRQAVIDPFFRDSVEKILLIEDKKRVAVSDIDIVVEKLIHDEDCYGFRFLSSSLSIGYIPDTEYFSGLIEKFKDTDVLILCVQNPFGFSTHYRLNADDAVKIIRGIKPSLAILTHFGSKMLDADPIFVARELRKQVDSEIIVAKDGLVVDPSTYAIGSVQSRLKF